MQELKNELKSVYAELVVFFKWVLFAIAVGIVVGLVSTGFYYSFEYVSAQRQAHSWFLYFLPLGGILITLIYRYSGMEHDRGTNFVLLAVRESHALPLRTAPLVYISTLITHLFGGSSGREGAILQIGGSISAFIGRLFHISKNDSRIITMCGMSAAFAALFGTPIAAAVFAMELISVGVMYYSAIVPCILSALVGVTLASKLGVSAVSFQLLNVPAFSSVLMLQVMALGILCAFVSKLFCFVMHKSEHLYLKYIPNPVLRAAAGGLLVIILTLVVQTSDYNGAGSHVIAAAIQGNARPEAFLLKILFTAVTLGAGFKGGEIVPTFFTGSCFGCVAASIMGLSPSFGAALGLISVFCGVTNCPISSIILAYEIFGGQHLPMFALCCAVSYMLSGYSGLYCEQKIIYSKLRPVFINRKAI